MENNESDQTSQGNHSTDETSIFGQLVIQFYPCFLFPFFVSGSYVVMRRRKRKINVEAKQIRHVLILSPENKS